MCALYLELEVFCFLNEDDPDNTTKTDGGNLPSSKLDLIINLLRHAYESTEKKQPRCEDHGHVAQFVSLSFKTYEVAENKLMMVHFSGFMRIAI